jgi:predicted GIY-YIG superfamily endonuclease
MSPDAENPAAMARFYMEVFTSLLERVPGEYRGDLESLSAWIEAGKPKLDFSRFAFSREFLKDIPEHPGVYIMRNRAGDIIYVGKSGNLKRRLRSYFTTRALKDPKIAKIHGQLHTLEFTAAASEVEALVMEMRLIRDFRPQFNLQAAVHERPPRYGRLRNMIILDLEDPEAQKATAYLVRDSLFAGRERVRLGSNPGRRLRARVRSVYFARRAKRKGPGEEWEREIISRWLSSNLKRLTAVDVDGAGDYASVIRQLRACLRDPDALSNKIYYR